MDEINSEDFLYLIQEIAETISLNLEATYETLCEKIYFLIYTMYYK